MLPSFEERSVWVQFVGLLVVLAGYGLVSVAMLTAGVSHPAPFVVVMSVATVLLVVLLAVGHAIAALAGAPEARDERDRLIGWRAESGSSWLLATGVVAAIGTLLVGWPALWVAHLLMLSLFASEILKLALQLRWYRKGV